MITPDAVSMAPANRAPLRESSPDPFTIAKSFHAAGLEADGIIEMEAGDANPAPKVWERGARFLIPSLGKDSGGRVFTFTSDTDRDSMRRYYSELGRSSGLLYSHVFVAPRVLVQINGELPQKKADLYGRALAQFKSR